jgi:hypothetical protein
VNRIAAALGVWALALPLTVSPAEAQTFVPQTPIRTYAQKLVDLVISENPQIMIFSIHALVEGSSSYGIIASNAPRLIGLVSGADKLSVINNNVSDAKPGIPVGAFEVFVPMHDVAGKTIGVLGFKFRNMGPDKQVYLDAATKVRDELQNVIPNTNTLYDKFYFTAAPTDDLAMQLLSRELIRHPDVWVLAFHVTPPGDTVNRLVGINYLKLMNEPSEPSEELLAKNGNTTMAAFPSTHRVETHVAMRDQQGNLIGTLATVYLFKDDADLSTVLARTVAIRDEVQRDIPSQAALVSAPAPSQ